MLSMCELVFVAVLTVHVGSDPSSTAGVSAGLSRLLNVMSWLASIQLVYEAVFAVDSEP
jgi:hypothetical protein